VIAPPASAEELRSAVVRAAGQGRLKFVLLVGDVPERLPNRSQPGRRVVATIPTNYVAARVNVRWGSEPTIATDQLYADIDRDGLPDVAVGRIPVDTSDELAAVVRKIVRYEHEAGYGTWRRHVHVVAGVGGFGRFADMLIEAAARRVISASVPAGYEIEPTMASPTSACCPPPGAFTAVACRQLSAGAFAWIYLGHGLPTTLDAVETPTGPRPILSVDDVRQLRCGAASPLAVLVACYTGAFDAASDCLAEELVTSEQGPVAVIAATRVTMPYGNAVFGHELLQACFVNRAATLGDVWLIAERSTVADAPDDPLRASLDALANGLSPTLSHGESPAHPLELAEERREHVLMYQLFGDPLLSLRLPQTLQLETASTATAGEMLAVVGKTGVPGTCVIELVTRAENGKDRVVARTSQRVGSQPFRALLPLPADAAGPYTARAFVSGESASAAGAASVTIERPQAIQISSAPDRPAVR
jgi:hypothetical protein